MLQRYSSQSNNIFVVQSRVVKRKVFYYSHDLSQTLLTVRFFEGKEHAMRNVLSIIINIIITISGYFRKVAP